MLYKTIVIIISILLFSGCSVNIRDYFKKSANNKLIDRKGFKGNKRAPLYNEKYIAIAKKNVLEENFDEDEDFYENDSNTPKQKNKQMYLKMVQDDARLLQNKKKPIDNKNRLNTAIEKVKIQNPEKDTQKFQKELLEIKNMLHETQKDLERYKCPVIKEEDNKIKRSDILISPKNLEITKETPDNNTPINNIESNINNNQKNSIDNIKTEDSISSKNFNELYSEEI